MKALSLLLVMLFASIQFAFAAVNINTATQAELETLKGVGPAKAKMIVDDRAKNGPFKSVDDLDRVKGFGMKSVDKLRSELSVSGATTVTAAPATKKAVVKPATATSAPVAMPEPAKKMSKKEMKAQEAAAKAAMPAPVK
ncbi:MAG: topoisomerase [Sulfuriferula sp.]|nr:topoisomerase [Sulfuriferula sp.]